MIVLIGTVPYKTGVYVGQARIEDDHLNVDNVNFPIERGTAAMAASCAQVCNFYGLLMPVCIFGGDISDGKGTDLMFQEVNDSIDLYTPDIITLHYLFPKIACGTPFVSKVNSLAKRPQLIADAGGMYLMKTINQSSLFDVFTPDEGELLFLADEFAAHPLYVRSDMLSKITDIDALTKTAYQHKNAARTMIIKGAVDYIYIDGIRINECGEPNIPAMEAIGGTGDTITGLVSGLRYRQDNNADFKAVVLNRLIGKRINCTPATQISEFIKSIPAVLEEYEKNPE